MSLTNLKNCSLKNIIWLKRYKIYNRKAKLKPQKKYEKGKKKKQTNRKGTRIELVALRKTHKKQKKTEASIWRVLRQKGPRPGPFRFSAYYSDQCTLGNWTFFKISFFGKHEHFWHYRTFFEIFWISFDIPKFLRKFLSIF